jgi:hypothetical protein
MLTRIDRAPMTTMSLPTEDTMKQSRCRQRDEITVDGGYVNMPMNPVPRPGFE